MQDFVDGMVVYSFFTPVLLLMHLTDLPFKDNQPSTLTVTISPAGLNGNKTSPIPPPPPPPPTPAFTLPEENEDPDKR